MRDLSLLFAIHGDLMKVHADAYLIPGDGRFTWGRWRGMVGDSPDPPPASDVSAQARPLVHGGRLFVLTDIGVSDESPSAAALSHVLGGVRDGFDVASDHLDRQHPTESLRERPLLAMPLVGSGAGGFRYRRGELVAELLEFLNEDIPSRPFDVVLVCWDRASYSAVQQERTRRPAASGLTETEERTTDNLAGFARHGMLALLFGAGASIPLGLPSWDALLSSFGSEIEVDGLDRLDALDAASLVVERLQDEARFLGMLQEGLRSSEYSLMHGLLASLQPRVAITTNYDQCFELAMRAALPSGRDVAVMPWQSPAAPEDVRLLKLHGDIDRGSIVLSRSQFIEMHAQRRPLTALLQDQFLAGHVLAVGTSLQDPTMAQAAEEVASLLRSVRHDRDWPSVGTWLQTGNDVAARALWGRVFSVSAPSAARSISASARHVDIVLDELGRRACTDVSFVADPHFKDLLAGRAGWAEVADQAQVLLAAVNAAEAGPETFSRLHSALIDLGTKDPG